MSDINRLIANREYAWNYFQLHASQRMSLFNYFVLISAILTAGLAGVLQSNGSCQAVEVLLAASLVFVSFTFWKLDQRVRFLVKHAESTLKKIEGASSHIGDNSDELTLFTKEEIETNRLRHEWKLYRPRYWHLSYSECFGIVYIIFAVLGILSMLWLILRTVPTVQGP